MALTQGLNYVASSSDEELVAAHRGGEDGAFEELYARYAGPIRSYTLRMVGDEARADDLTQEIFIAAMRGLRKSELPVTFKPWVYEIARNASIDELRRRRRRREVPLQLDPDIGIDSIARPLHPEGPEAALEGKQRLDDLRGAFHGLSDSHHRVLVLRELEGLSYEDIGQRLGMRRSAVESTLFRARRKLSDEYRELVSGRRCEVVQAAIAQSDAHELQALGVRNRRQLARHVVHCQACGRHARLAGVFDALVKPPKRSRLAGLLGIPWLRPRRSRSGATASEARFSALARPVNSLGSLPDPLEPLRWLSRPGAVLLATLVAGAGGGAVIAAGGGGPHSGARASSAAQAASLSRAAGHQSSPSSASGAAGPRGAGTAPGQGRSGSGPGLAGGHSGGATPGQMSAGAPAGAPGTGIGASGSSTVRAAGTGTPLRLGQLGATGTSVLAGAGRGLLGAVHQVVTHGVSGVAGGATHVPLPHVSVPSLPHVSAPSLPPVHVPSLALPRATVPSLPHVSAPSLPHVPASPLPHVSAPSLPHVPASPLPHISVPSLPHVSRSPLAHVSALPLPHASLPAKPPAPSPHASGVSQALGATTAPVTKALPAAPVIKAPSARVLGGLGSH